MPWAERAFCTLIAVLVLLAPGGRVAAQDEGALWGALRDGTAFAIMRHALAPGTGDPADFALDDCGTQRNLSEDGRRQAAEIGARIRAQGIARAAVFSSQWCRCLDTAEGLALGPTTPLPLLNSFFATPERGDAQIEALKGWLADKQLDAPLILVTHQVNITALTGVFPASGQIVVTRLAPDGTITVLGSL